MARTIGIKNVNLVKKLTRAEVEKSVNTEDIEENVIALLPVKLFDIWEAADAEIRRIIWDTTFDEM